MERKNHTAPVLKQIISQTPREILYLFCSRFIRHKGLEQLKEGSKKMGEHPTHTVQDNTQTCSRFLVVETENKCLITKKKC